MQLRVTHTGANGAAALSAMTGLLGIAAAVPRPALNLSSTLGNVTAENDWQVLSYGFDVDPSMPSFIKRTTKLFQLTEDDVSIAPASLANGATVYSTSDDTRASKLAVRAHIEGGKGPYSAAASMQVTDDSDHEIKTARFDVTRSFNKFAVTSGVPLQPGAAAREGVLGLP